MNYVLDLKEFYNSEAEKFSDTRKKYWPEFSYILEEIESHEKEFLKILEIWCWDWRFLNYIKKNSSKKISYTWVDLSENLISIATQNNPKSEFIIWDMCDVLESMKQQQYDIVIAIASFQHIYSYDKRMFVLKHLYRLLDYWWMLIMINWSYSKKFLKKNFSQIIKSLLLWLIPFSKMEYNDLFISWNWTDKIYKRYYHIFRLSELVSLFKQAWFVIYQSWYVNQNWFFSFNWFNSRNSFMIGKKDVW